MENNPVSNNKTNETQNISKLEAQIENTIIDVNNLKFEAKALYTEFTEVKSKCLREQCKVDHDTLIKIIGQIENSNKILEENKEFQLESRTQRQEMNTNINMLTDKVANIIKTHDTTSDMKRNVIIGVAITVISAILIGGFTMILDSQKSRDEDLKKVTSELVLIKSNQNYLKAVQAEMETNQVKIMERQK